MGVCTECVCVCLCVRLQKKSQTLTHGKNQCQNVTINLLTVPHRTPPQSFSEFRDRTRLCGAFILIFFIKSETLGSLIAVN